MDNKTLASISKNVARSFPGVDWDQPRVQRNQVPQAKSGPAASTYLLIFRGTAHQANGKSMPRQVRVVANEKGQIIRMSTSR